MDEQFGGRTDDDLFADDFDPVQPSPEKAHVQPDPVDVKAEVPVAVDTAADVQAQGEGEGQGEGQPLKNARRRQPKPRQAPAQGQTQTQTQTQPQDQQHQPQQNHQKTDSRSNTPRTNTPRTNTPRNAPKESKEPREAKDKEKDVKKKDKKEKADRTQKAEEEPQNALPAVHNVPPPTLAQSRHNLPQTLAQSRHNVPPPSLAQSRHYRPPTPPAEESVAAAVAATTDASTKGPNSAAPTPTPTAHEFPTTLTTAGPRPRRERNRRSKKDDEPKANSETRANGSGNASRTKAERADKATHAAASVPPSTAPRTQSGANPRRRMTEAELEERLAVMRAASLEKTRRFEKEQRDEHDHELALRVAEQERKKKQDLKREEDKKRAEVRREEEKKKAESRAKAEVERRKLDEERARNRDRKLKAMGASDGNWDQGKDQIKDQMGAHAAPAAPKANNTGLSASRHAAAPAPANGQAPKAVVGVDGANGHGTPSRRGRGGKKPQQFNDAGSVGADVAEWVQGTPEPDAMASTMAPPSVVAEAATAAAAEAGGTTATTGTSAVVNGSKPSWASLAKKEDAAKTPKKEVVEKKTGKLHFKPLPRLEPLAPGISAWDEEVEAEEAAGRL